jgi:hypothetical protein
MEILRQTSRDHEVLNAEICTKNEQFSIWPFLWKIKKYESEVVLKFKIVWFIVSFYIILHGEVQHFNNTASKCWIVAMFKCFVKQDNDSNKTCFSIPFYCTKRLLSKCTRSWVLSVGKITNFICQALSAFVYRFLAKKNGRIKRSSSFEALSAYRISWFHVYWSIHLRIQASGISELLSQKHLTVNKVRLPSNPKYNTSSSEPFRIYSKLRDYKLWSRGYGEWHVRAAEFYKNLQIASKVIRGDTQTDRQNGNLMSFNSVFKESRLNL